MTSATLSRGPLLWSGEHWILYLRPPGSQADSGQLSLYCAAYSPAGRGTVAYIDIPGSEGLGADIHVRDENGWTALMKATVSGHLDAVRFLVDRGADVNARNESGDTALTWAVEGLQIEGGEKKKCYEEVVAFLRAAEAV